MSYQSSSECPRKKAARQEAIIDFYRENFGRDSIPDDKQYWTLAGPCFNTKGEVGEYAEPIQMVNSGLIRPDQYRGVEKNIETLDKNREALPDYDFIHGEFVDVIRSYRDFRPEIIYLDTISMHGKATTLLEETMHCVNNSGVSRILITLNMIWENPYGGTDRIEPQKIVHGWMGNARFVHAYRDSWEIQPVVMAYDGTGRSKTKMLSFFLTKGAKKSVAG